MIGINISLGLLAFSFSLPFSIGMDFTSSSLTDDADSGPQTYRNITRSNGIRILFIAAIFKFILNFDS